MCCSSMLILHSASRLSQHSVTPALFLFESVLNLLVRLLLRLNFVGPLSRPLWDPALASTENGRGMVIPVLRE